MTELSTTLQVLTSELIAVKSAVSRLFLFPSVYVGYSPVMALNSTSFTVPLIITEEPLCIVTSEGELSTLLPSLLRTSLTTTPSTVSVAPVLSVTFILTTVLFPIVKDPSLRISASISTAVNNISESGMTSAARSLILRSVMY
ncbi:MAG: hypothetical protein IJV90_03830, partial [Candidatus Methanomethylophilaceae archaeon]|nr:hypothetical protein [Candidatus Methanomethylophilaceae archaeon]